ncbi:unnamed protein product, partial [Amoebophrya sp. A25]
TRTSSRSTTSGFAISELLQLSILTGRSTTSTTLSLTKGVKTKKNSLRNPLQEWLPLGGQVSAKNVIEGFLWVLANFTKLWDSYEEYVDATKLALISAYQESCFAANGKKFFTGKQRAALGALFDHLPSGKATRKNLEDEKGQIVELLKLG